MMLNPPNLTPAFARELEQIEEACNKLGFWTPATVYQPQTPTDSARRIFMWRKGPSLIRYAKTGIVPEENDRWRFMYKMTPKGESSVRAFNNAPTELVATAPASVQILFASHLPKLLKAMRTERAALNTRLGDAVDTLYEMRCALDKEVSDAG